jgi:hypothetical protein
MSADNWQLAPLRVLLISLSSKEPLCLLTPVPSRTQANVEREVAQPLEPTETPVPYLLVELRLWIVVVGFPVSHHCPHGLGKMLKEKSHSHLNLTGSPQMAVPYALFVELRLWS